MTRFEARRQVRRPFSSLGVIMKWPGLVEA